MKAKYIVGTHNGQAVPISKQVVDAAERGDRKGLERALQAYLFRYLIPTKGANWMQLTNAVNAHFKLAIDPKYTVQHVKELQKRGLIEQTINGNWRVKAEVRDTAQEMLLDDGVMP